MEVSYDDAITALKLIECCECRERLLAADCYSPICNRGYAVRLAIKALEEKKSRPERITCGECKYRVHYHYQDDTTEDRCVMTHRKIGFNDFCSCGKRLTNGS